MEVEVSEGMSLSVKDGFIHERSLLNLEKILETSPKRTDSTRVYVIKELIQGILIVKRVSVFDQPYSAEDIKRITKTDVEPGTYRHVEIDIAKPVHYLVNGELEILIRSAGILHFPSPQNHLGEEYYRGIYRRMDEMENIYYSRN